MLHTIIHGCMFLFGEPISHSPLSLHLLFLSAAKFSFIFCCERSCATSPQTAAINIGLVHMLLQMALDCGIFFDVVSIAFKRRSKKKRLMPKPAIAGFKRQKTSHLASAALNEQLKQLQCHDRLGTAVTCRNELPQKGKFASASSTTRPDRCSS